MKIKKLSIFMLTHFTENFSSIRFESRIEDLYLRSKRLNI